MIRISIRLGVFLAVARRLRVWSKHLKFRSKDLG